MNVLPMNNPVYVDVDGTLVRERTEQDKENFEFPFHIKHPLRDGFVTKTIMHANTQLLRDMHARGRTIVVWSQAGYQWAEAVCKALDLDKLSPPIYVCEKPIAYIDDLECSAFMGQRIFLND